MKKSAPVSYLQLFALIFGIHMMAVMSPGPDFVMVLRNALQYNRKIAIFTALGISLGIAIHIFYSVAGIAYLLQKNTALFQIIKIAGAIYIIYIGYKTLKSSPVQIQQVDTVASNSITNWEALKIGFVTNVLNPKASLFFLSLFSMLIPPNLPWNILLGISLMLIVVTFLWFALVSVIFTHKKIVSYYEKYEPYILKIFGVILILLGLAIFFE